MNKQIKAIASAMPGNPYWTVAVFPAKDVPDGTKVGPIATLASPQVAPEGDARYAELWRAHAGKLDALVAHCPTCCAGFTASAEMTRDEIIFACGKSAGRQEIKDAQQSPDFETWVKRAYRDAYDSMFTVYNMEVAWQAGRAATPVQVAPTTSNARLLEIGEMREMLGNIAARVLSEPRPLEFCRKIDAELAALIAAPAPVAPAEVGRVVFRANRHAPDVEWNANIDIRNGEPLYFAASAPVAPTLTTAPDPAQSQVDRALAASEDAHTIRRLSAGVMQAFEERDALPSEPEGKD